MIGAVETPDSLVAPTRPQVDFGNFTLKFFTDLFSWLQLAPDRGVPSVVSGKVAIVTTAAAVALPNNPLQNGIVVKAGKANSASISIGGSGTVNNTMTSAGNGYELAAGEAISLSVSNASFVFINGTAGDFVSFIGN